MKWFDYDSPFIQFIIFLSRLTFLNVIWFLGCLPLVTAGASTVGLYYAVNQLRLGDVAVWKNFRTGWKRNWKQATPVWLVFALVVAAFLYDYFVLAEQELWGNPVMVALAILGMVTLLMTALWVYPVMINFQGTLMELVGNAFIFAFLYAPLSLAGAAMYIILAWVLVKHHIIGGVIIVFAVALIVYATLLLNEIAFRKYRSEKR